MNLKKKYILYYYICTLLLLQSANEQLSVFQPAVLFLRPLAFFFNFLYLNLLLFLCKWQKYKVNNNSRKKAALKLISLRKIHSGAGVYIVFTGSVQ